MTLSDADKFCAESGAELSDLRNMTAVQQCPDIEGDLWTSSIIYATPYVSLVGKFSKTYMLRWDHSTMYIRVQVYILYLG